MAKSPTSKRYDEKTKKTVALAISVGRMTLTEAMRTYNIGGSETIYGWLRNYAPDFKRPLGRRGPKRKASKGRGTATASQTSKGRAKAVTRKGGAKGRAKAKGLVKARR